MNTVRVQYYIFYAQSVLDVGLNMLNREGIPDITALLLQDENNAFFQVIQYSFAQIVLS